MPGEANRCPNCGAERPANTREGLCPRCEMLRATTDAAPDPGGVDATTAPAAAGSGHAPEPTPGDAEATGVHIAAAVPSTAPVPHDATDGSAPDPNLPTRTADGHGSMPNLPRGATVRYFGDYEIEKELGRGGMGVVYKARQITLNRPVALKMIKAGVLADDAELRRFQNEAEAIALLDHAGIVPIYEVGEHDSQRFFSMKLVEGGNLAEQLARFKDNPRAAATLLAETAEAVHHAHMRGILHRDLKPANILIDAEGHPHVTDFGMAKRVEADVELTASGAIMGTPAYMSPEQAAGRRGTITTATDVYGLGAILYALLTGNAPFGGESLADTLQAVKERPPEPPRNLNSNVPRDLETICLKCLAKDPRRRYTSAQALADDLRCWLNSRPITARRVGPAERAWLWCKRKPAIAALAASVMLAVVGGTTAIFAVQAKANANLRSSNDKLDQANSELKSSNTLLEQQRARAEEREKQAIDAVKKFRDAVADNPELKNNPSLKSLRKTLLKEPLAFFRSLRAGLQADGDTKPESLARLAAASFELGTLTNEIGDKQDALIAYRESLEIRQKLADANPGVIAFQSDLARICNSIGSLQGTTGRQAEALASFEQARVIWERLSRENPSVSEFQRSLAWNYHNIGFLQDSTGHHVEALAMLEQARAIRDRLVRENPSVTEFQHDLARSHNNIGAMRSAMGRPAEALVSFEQARVMWERLSRQNPSVTEFQRMLAWIYHNIGFLQESAGRHAEALALYEQARAIRDRLARENPSVTVFQFDLARSHTSIGAMRSAMGRPAETLVSFEQARVIWELLSRENPSVTDFQRSLAWNYHNAGILQCDMGRQAEALASLEKALAIHTRLATENPSVTVFQYDLARSHNDIGRLLRTTGRPVQALGSFEQARAIWERQARENPLFTEQSGLASSYQNIGILEREKGRPQGAMTWFEKARAIWERQTREHPESPEFASDLGGILNDMAMIDLGERRLDQGRAKLTRAIELQRKALASNPANPNYRQFLTDHLRNLITAYRGLGDPNGVSKAERELAEIRDSDPAMVDVDARLLVIIKGDQQPKDEAERLQLAQRAHDKAFHRTAAKLWSDALAANPKLIDDRQAAYRYHAACAAALAACANNTPTLPSPIKGEAKTKNSSPLVTEGKTMNSSPIKGEAKTKTKNSSPLVGEDTGGGAATQLTEAERTKLRRQALDWLNAELAVHAKLLGSGSPDAKAFVAQTLKHWQNDPDLAGIREANGLGALPESERALWRTLWAGVAALLETARAAAGPAK